MSSSSDPLAAALADLDALESAGLAALGQAAAPAAVEAVRIEYLGLKQGRLKTAQERLKTLEPSARRGYGQRFNAVKQALETAHAAARARVERPATAVAGGLDVTLPGRRPGLGHRRQTHHSAEHLDMRFGAFGHLAGAIG